MFPSWSNAGESAAKLDVQEKTTNGAPEGPTAAGNGSQSSHDAETQPGGAETPQEPPVDIDRLNEFTDGNLDSLRELVTLYLDQTTTQLEQLEAAIQAHSAMEVRRLAHSCAGASATCGMRRLVPMLRELEHKGEKQTPGRAAICKNASREFERIRTF
jgi:HPt (histidine-containing phosphotransfer) domain-containing protein